MGGGREKAKNPKITKSYQGSEKYCAVRRPSPTPPLPPKNQQADRLTEKYTDRRIQVLSIVNEIMNANLRNWGLNEINNANLRIWGL